MYKDYGQIGVAHDFLIFPDKETGRLALIKVLKTVYADSSIEQMMKKFAPPNENDTVAYIKYLQKVTGVNDDRTINSFTEEQFEKLLKGFIQCEGYKEGNIVQIHKITHVRKENHKSINKYHAESLVWINKEKCIFFAKKDQVELEVCASHLGNSYLKAAHGSFQPKLSKSID